MRDRTSYEIRRAELADALQLHALIKEHAAFERGQANLRVEDLATLLAGNSPPAEVIVAATKSDVLGYASFTFDFSLWRGHKWAHLDCLFVREHVRGQAVGAALLARVREIASNSGVDRLEGQTPEWNAGGIAFYKREGAEIIAKARFQFSLRGPVGRCLF